MSNPKFSIIIPSHNGIPHITMALESCYKQEYKNFEVIVVCDACDDNTENVAKAYGAKTVTVNHHRDGLSRNAGLDIATGDWVLFLDDDDWWLHEFVLTQLAPVTDFKSDNDIIFFSVVYRHRGVLQQTAEHYEKFAAGHCIKREFIGDTRFSDKAWGSDYDFFDQLLMKKPYCSFWNMPMYYYNWMREGCLTWNFVREKGG